MLISNQCQEASVYSKSLSFCLYTQFLYNFDKKIYKKLDSSNKKTSYVYEQCGLHLNLY